MAANLLGASSSQLGRVAPDIAPGKLIATPRRLEAFGVGKQSRAKPVSRNLLQQEAQRLARAFVAKAGPGYYGNGSVEPLNLVFVSAEVSFVSRSSKTI